MKNSVPNSKSCWATWTALSLAALTAGTLSLPRTAAADSAIAVTSNAFPQSYSLTINEDSTGVIQGLTYANLPPITVASLQKGPQPIFTDDGKNIISLSLDSDFTAQKGGHIEMVFVTNARTQGDAEKDYKDFRILVDVQGDDVVLRSDPNLSDPHSDKNSYTGVFNSLYFKKATLLGIEIGVSGVTPSETVEVAASSAN